MSYYADLYEDERIPCTLISEKLVRARKDHVCNCGEVIKAGRTYWRRFWIVDGEPYAEKYCGGCF